jgi:hypothetical protein
MFARAAITGADPPGLIYFISDEHLASQLQDPIELLKRTVTKCLNSKKIKIFENKKKKIFILKIVNWEKYQHIYMHQRAYRQREKAKKEAQKKIAASGTEKHRRDIAGEWIGEDRDRIGNDKDRIGKETPSPPVLSTPEKINFLSLLKDLSKDIPYPFDEGIDGHLYDISKAAYPHVDLLREVEKKFDYWKQHPEELQGNVSLRQKLKEFFRLEEVFQVGRGK